MNNKSKIYTKYERYNNTSSNLNSILECKKLKHVFHVSRESRETVLFTIIIQYLHSYNKTKSHDEQRQMQVISPVIESHIHCCQWLQYVILNSNKCGFTADWI